MNLDFKKFKKVSSDEKSTTLRHADGHEIKIAHKKLSPKHKAELEQHFADGGEVQSDDKAESAKKLGIKNSELEAMDKIPIPEAQRDPASVGAQSEAPSFQQKIDNFVNNSNSTASDMAGSIADTAGNAWDAIKRDSLKKPEAPAVAPAAAPAAPTPSLSPPIAGPGAMPAQMPGMGLAPAAQDADPYGTQAYQNTYMSGLNQEKAGVQQEAAAQGALGKEQARLAHDQQGEIQKAQQAYQGEHQKLTDEYNAVINDVKNQHINPNHYQQNMSSGQKVGAAIGMILSGFGSGLSGQENMAMKFLNDQINRDIEAQKLNLGKSETLLSANLKQTGNLNDATQMTVAMQKGIYASKLEEAAGKSADPIARARALAKAGELQMQAAPILSQIAMKKTMMNAMQSGPENADKMLQVMRVVDPAKAKEMESRYVPNVGFASVPVPETVRKELVGRNELQHGLESLMKFAKQHEGTVMDPAVQNQGHTLAKQVQDSYRRANGQGVFREGEAAFVNSIIDEDPTKFFAKFRTLPKYQTALAMNRNALNSTLQGYGLQPLKDLSALEQKPKFK